MARRATTAGLFPGGPNRDGNRETAEAFGRDGDQEHATGANGRPSFAGIAAEPGGDRPAATADARRDHCGPCAWETKPAGNREGRRETAEAFGVPATGNPRDRGERATLFRGDCGRTRGRPNGCDRRRKARTRRKPAAPGAGAASEACGRAGDHSGPLAWGTKPRREPQRSQETAEAFGRAGDQEHATRANGQPSFAVLRPMPVGTEPPRPPTGTGGAGSRGGLGEFADVKKPGARRDGRPERTRQPGAHELRTTAKQATKSATLEQGPASYSPSVLKTPKKQQKKNKKKERKKQPTTEHMVNGKHRWRWLRCC